MIDEEKERYINPYTNFGFTPQDAREYEESVRIYRDLTNVVNTAERKGREEGRAELPLLLSWDIHGNLCLNSNLTSS